MALRKRQPHTCLLQLYEILCFMAKSHLAGCCNLPMKKAGQIGRASNKGISCFLQGASQFLEPTIKVLMFYTT